MNGLRASPSGAEGLGGEESRLLADPRLALAVSRFNEGDWYGCHDGFEELWHETQGPVRPVLQGILQIAVAQLHLERGNISGATMLLGEGLGRLAACEREALGLRLEPLLRNGRLRLRALQSGGDGALLPLPMLEWAEEQRR